MNRKFHTPPSKPVAALLLVLFLFIHLGKALHQHNHSTATFSVEAAQELKSLAHCDVCDFDIAKDCDSELTFVDFAISPKFGARNSYYQSFATASIGLIYADRGPPAQS